MKRILQLALLPWMGLMLCLSQPAPSVPPSPKSPAKQPEVPAGAETITLGAGCFWCTEAVYQQIPGVLSVTSGYMGGTVPDPTYEQVCTGETGHAEVALLVFDPQVTSLEKILTKFWQIHDPTSLNRQGADVGTHYRSAIFYNSDAQRQVAEKSRDEAARDFAKPIVTEITRATAFYPAENYHQNYYRLNKDRNPYCQRVIAPKLKKAGLKE
ncbi:MAG: peptide-methionine (S)-S-oxide reductase MsrA [Verrucomicrobiae bacterium]|nr:peptide-methionine (S)-S-oxide reductase MsrA [Verrucomicrobiae bacterium]